jgi:hypothetical protein
VRPISKMKKKERKENGSGEGLRPYFPFAGGY